MTRKATRRQFLQRVSAASAGVLSVPFLAPATALRRDDKPAPSNRIVIGCIGTGRHGKFLIDLFTSFKDVQLVAVCDVDSKHRNAGRDLVDQKYGNKNCAAYNDFRELLARKDIDAVIVATPDHWHALAAVAAAQADKDIYCEKPLVNSIAEGRAVCEAVKKHRRILQTGSYERSGDNSRFACELVRNGRIGKLHTVRVNLPCDDGHHRQVRAVTTVSPEMPVPKGFDYDFWLGHTPKVPYTEGRCHVLWRFIQAYGGGEMTDRGAHIIDIAQLGAGTDDSGPVEIEARGTASKSSLYDVFWDYEFVNTYGSGLKLVGSAKGPRGVKFEGSDGWVFIHLHGGKLAAEPGLLLKETIKKGEIQLSRSPKVGNDLENPRPRHVRNFLDSIKSRQQPLAPAEVGHRTASVCHLNIIAMRLGRKLRWDPVKEQFADDAEANRLLKPTMREPWKL